MDNPPHSPGSPGSADGNEYPARVPFRYRLETKLTLALVLTALVPLILFAGFTIRDLHQAITETSESILSATTRDYVDRIDTWIRRGIDQVRMAARFPAFADAVSRPAASVSYPLSIGDDLDSLVQQSPVFIRSVALYNMAGETVVHSAGSTVPGSGLERPWFEVPLLTAEPTFQVALEESGIGQLAFTAPLLQKGEPVGVIRIGYHLVALHHLLTLLTEVTSGASFVAIVADDGVLLASDLPLGIDASANWIPGEPVPLAILEDALPLNQFEDLIEVDFQYMDVSRWTACIQSLEEVPWNIVYFLPKERFLAPIRRKVSIALVLTGGLIALLVAMGFAFGRVFSHDLRRLAIATQSLASGDLEIRVPERTRDETGLLARSFNYMASQLSQRTTALIEARHQAEEASRAKSEFLSVMSHEVRTPLNSVIGYSDVLLNDPSLKKEHSTVIQTIKRSGRDLLGLLNNMLDFSKIEAGKVEVDAESFAILGLLSDVIEHTAAEAARKNLEVFIEPVGAVPVNLTADGPKIRQILLNLVSNSVKFTSEGGVRIYIETAFKPGRETADLLVLVEDSGIGITPEVRSRLFKPFSQGDSSVTRKYGGTGLGLAISRQIAHALGGDLTECSPASGGASFALSVPVYRDGEENLPQTALQPEHKGKCVCLVSENAFSTTVYKSILSQTGLLCTLPDQPVDRVPDLIILDEPAQATAMFQRLSREVTGATPEAPVLRLVGHYHTAVRAKVPENTPILEKPILTNELISRLNYMLTNG